MKTQKNHYCILGTTRPISLDLAVDFSGAILRYWLFITNQPLNHCTIMAFVVVFKPELAKLRPMTLKDGPEKWERTLFFIVLQWKEDVAKKM